MDSFFAEIYLTEIVTQCRYALNAATQVDPSNVALSGLHPDVAREELFRNIHSLLTHASNVSRLLWPAPRATTAVVSHQRATDLRTLLGVPDDNHSLKDRTLRDHLEHFDERLDDWARTSQRHNIIFDLVGPPSAIVGIDSGDVVRAFDNTTGKFVVRGEAYDVRTIVGGVRQILQRASRALESVRSERMRSRAEPTHAPEPTGPATQG